MTIRLNNSTWVITERKALQHFDLIADRLLRLRPGKMPEESSFLSVIPACKHVNRHSRIKQTRITNLLQVNLLQGFCGRIVPWCLHIRRKNQSKLQTKRTGPDLELPICAAYILPAAAAWWFRICNFKCALDFGMRAADDYRAASFVLGQRTCSQTPT